MRQGTKASAQVTKIVIVGYLDYRGEGYDALAFTSHQRRLGTGPRRLRCEGTPGWRMTH